MLGLICRYRVLIKCCVFYKDFRIFWTMAFLYFPLVSVCQMPKWRYYPLNSLPQLFTSTVHYLLCKIIEVGIYKKDFKKKKRQKKRFRSRKKGTFKKIRKKTCSCSRKKGRFRKKIIIIKKKEEGYG